MKISIEKLLLAGALAGSALLLGGCGTGGGYVDEGPDFYGPSYGGAVYYGHPWYGHDDHISRPPERHFQGHAGGGAPHPSAPRPSGGGGGGGGRTTPEPHNQRG